MLNGECMGWVRGGMEIEYKCVYRYIHRVQRHIPYIVHCTSITVPKWRSGRHGHPIYTYSPVHAEVGRRWGNESPSPSDEVAPGVVGRANRG